jgi:uncharacterized protein
MGDPVVHFEITSENSERTKIFYSGMFKWKFAQGPHQGVLKIDTGNPKGIQGSLLERGDSIPDYISLFIEVDNLEDSISKVEKLGGKVIRPPFRPSPDIKLAIIEDPEGHVLTLRMSSTKAK